MKKYFLFFVMAAALVSCNTKKMDQVAAEAARQQINDALKDSTQVKLVDSVYNFGAIAEGEKVEHNFRFKNIGSKPLVITASQPSCGCTVAEKPEKPVLPGETDFIKVVFNSKGKEGHQEKTIIVSSNAKPAFTTLKLLGEVKK